MFVPKNEQGVVVRFAEVCSNKEFPWEISSIQVEYPDAILVHRDTQETIRAEFEFRSSNFIQHGHDVRGCDVVICWINDLDDRFPITVWELGSEDFGEWSPYSDLEVRVWELERENKRLRTELSSGLHKKTRPVHKAQTPRTGLASLVRSLMHPHMPYAELMSAIISDRVSTGMSYADAVEWVSVRKSQVSELRTKWMQENNL